MQASITKSGNSHVRRLLVEVAWHYCTHYVAGKTMLDRWELASGSTRPGDEGNPRLRARWVTFKQRRKRHGIANVAIAREVAGWCSSLAVMKD